MKKERYNYLKTVILRTINSITTKHGLKLPVEEIEDIVGDTWLSVYRSIDKKPTECSEVTWIVRCVYFTTLNAMNVFTKRKQQTCSIETVEPTQLIAKIEINDSLLSIGLTENKKIKEIAFMLSEGWNVGNIASYLNEKPDKIRKTYYRIIKKRLKGDRVEK